MGRDAQCSLAAPWSPQWLLFRVKTLYGTVFCPCSPAVQGQDEIFFPAFSDSAGFATWARLNDIYCTIRAVLDLSMDNGTLFPTLGPWHL